VNQKYADLAAAAAKKKAIRCVSGTKKYLKLPSNL
jgi:hypothetical protein